MSAVLAIASPRRIKATHRRRRKIAAGHFVQRYYDPAIGRFLSVDPAGAGFNAYNYANNNPYRFTDPDGRKANDSQPKPTTPNPDWPPDRPAGCGTTRTCWVGSDEKWHTTPVPSGGDFSSGVADGFSSLLKGNYRFARQTYRTVNFSNTEEFKKTRTESEVVDALVDLVANDKDVQKKIAAKIEDKIRNAPYDSPRFWGYILGRVGVGMLLAPLGASATAGDGLQLVEDGVRDPAALIIGAFEGRH